jgi:hypothetical protein
MRGARIADVLLDKVEAVVSTAKEQGLVVFYGWAPGGQVYGYFTMEHIAGTERISRPESWAAVTSGFRREQATAWQASR